MDTRSNDYQPTPAPSEHHYLVSHFGGAEAQATAVATPPFGPGFTAADAAGCDHLEAWGTKFSFPGPDHVKWRLIRDGEIVSEKQVAGY